MNTELKIYLSNVYQYTNSTLVGEWVTLPIDPIELEKIEKRILSYGGEELFITESSFFINQYANFKKYNEVFFNAKEEGKLQDAILLLQDSSCPSIEEVEKILNEQSYFIYDCEDLVALGNYIIEENLVKNAEIMKQVIDYIDVESVGSDYSINNGLTELNNCFIQIYY